MAANGFSQHMGFLIGRKHEKFVGGRTKLKVYAITVSFMALIMLTRGEIGRYAWISLVLFYSFVVVVYAIESIVIAFRVYFGKK